VCYEERDSQSQRMQLRLGCEKHEAKIKIKAHIQKTVWENWWETSHVRSKWGTYRGRDVWGKFAFAHLAILRYINSLNNNKKNKNKCPTLAPGPQ